MIEGNFTNGGPMEGKVNELIDLLEIDPEALREAEFMQAQAVLETMVGKQIAQASIDETRITVTTSDGSKYFFYGFLGEDTAT